MIDLNTIEYKWYNERDIEGPAFIQFIKSHPDIQSLYDVGAHWSWSYYAPEVRKLIKKYDGIDILPDPQTAAILDNYTVSNVLDQKKLEYDLVSCISTIEHAGISTYQVDDYKKEQKKIFKKMVKFAKKYLFLTFPYGKEALHKGEFANITHEQLVTFLSYIPDESKHEKIFYYSDFPQGKIPFRVVDQQFADTVDYQSDKGTRCVCILTIEK